MALNLAKISYIWHQKHKKRLIKWIDQNFKYLLVEDTIIKMKDMPQTKERI